MHVKAIVHPVKHFRTIWISDIHLGFRGAQADKLLDFLKHTESDYMFLVGDIIDGWKLKNGWYWPQEHNDVVQKILRKARKGCKVLYLPGNHDEFGREYLGFKFGGIQVMNEKIHKLADGRRFLIVHGDQFDVVVRYARWLAFLGDYAYSMAIWANQWVNLFRKMFGLPYWSLSNFLKQRVKTAVNFIGEFEEALVHLAHDRKVDGIVCGHIHHAAMKQIGDIWYCNDGDWVESCTALVEHRDGRLELISWATAKDRKAVLGSE